MISWFYFGWIFASPSPPGRQLICRHKRNDSVVLKINFIFTKEKYDSVPSPINILCADNQTEYVYLGKVTVKSSKQK